mmetsp:Transcript_95716/g.309001  ORF Transcript_95716/g.309001 Transcript_95716/m.309001 type:complete len:202 (+) Transcript_95716:89-694(+)
MTSPLPWLAASSRLGHRRSATAVGPAPNAGEIASATATGGMARLEKFKIGRFTVTRECLRPAGEPRQQAEVSAPPAADVALVGDKRIAGVGSAEDQPAAEIGMVLESTELPPRLTTSAPPKLAAGGGGSATLGAAHPGFQSWQLQGECVGVQESGQRRGHGRQKSLPRSDVGMLGKAKLAMKRLGGATPKRNLPSIVARIV